MFETSKEEEKRADGGAVVNPETAEVLTEEEAKERKLRNEETEEWREQK